MMIASQIIRNNYNKFKDKTEITTILNCVFSIELQHVDSEGKPTPDAFEPVANELRRFVKSTRTSKKIKELAIECVEKMNYKT